MRSVCKNCHFAKKDGERIVCSRTLKYVGVEYICKRFALAEDKGDIDKHLFLVFTAVLIGATLIGLVLTLL